MTQTLGINNDNDIYLNDSGNIALLSGIEAVADACRTISRAQLGEMVLTASQGIPNFQTVWIGVPNLRLWQSYLKNAIINVDGVQEIKNLEYETKENVLSYIITIKTTFGITQING